MHLWKQQDDDGHWTRLPIPEEGLALCRSDEGSLALGAQDRGRLAALLVPFVENGVARVALLRSPLSEDMWLNGSRPVGDLHVLQDRDEIALHGDALYFGTAGEAEITLFPEIDAQTLCARCTGILRAGDRSVACPACGAWHHEGALVRSRDEERSCWSYDEKCGACHRVRESLCWSPEDEDA